MPRIRRTSRKLRSKLNFYAERKVIWNNLLPFHTHTKRKEEGYEGGEEGREDHQHMR